MAEVIRLRPNGGKDRAAADQDESASEPAERSGVSGPGSAGPGSAAGQPAGAGMIGPERAEAIARAQDAAKRMYDADAASRHLGIEISDVRPGHAVARMRVVGNMVNGHSVAHGGYVFLLADTAFAFACNTYGAPTVARGAEVHFVSAAKPGDELVATAYERTRYGRNGIYDVTVRRADGSIVAEFRGQSHVLANPPGSGADESKADGLSGKSEQQNHLRPPAPHESE